MQMYLKYYALSQIQYYGIFLSIIFFTKFEDNCIQIVYDKRVKNVRELQILQALCFACVYIIMRSVQVGGIGIMF